MSYFSNHFYIPGGYIVFILDLLEGKQSLSVGDLITLKVNMFLEALLVFLYMIFGYFYMLLPLNCIKVYLCSICSQSEEKLRKRS